MRADGRPSAATVASDIEFTIGIAAATASSNHSLNCAMRLARDVFLVEAFTHVFLAQLGDVHDFVRVWRAGILPARGCDSGAVSQYWHARRNSQWCNSSNAP